MKNLNLMNDDIKNLNRLTKNLSEVLIKAFEYTKMRDGEALDERDVFLGILDHKKNIAARLLARLGVDLDATSNTIMKGYQSGSSIVSPKFGVTAKKMLSKSFLISSDLNHVYVGTEHVLLAIMGNNKLDFVQDLEKNGLNYEFLRQALINFGIYQPGVFAKADDQQDEDQSVQSNLQFFARDMNVLAQEGKYLEVWGRGEEVERMIHILSRRTKNNPILVGEAGVGKTAIVQGFVQRILTGDVPESFRNKKVIQLDLSAIIAGSKIRGDIEERLLSIINEVSEDPDLIVFIDEIHMIVGAGAAGSGSSMDVANILKPYLTNGDLRVIGATTYDEYQKYIEEDEALARRFQSVAVDEISPDDAVNVLKMLRPEFEQYHKVKITDEALKEAVTLSDRYIASKYLPDKAIDVMDEATAAKKIKMEKKLKSINNYKDELNKINELKDTALDKGDIEEAVKYRQDEVKMKNKLKKDNKKNNVKKYSKKYIVNAEDVRTVVSRWSKVPINTMQSSDIKLLSKLGNNLSKKIIGQNDSINRIASTLKRAKMGLSSEKRPMASFLFLGPTGVGKTETAKEIARTMFGGEDALIQVDMSEFIEQHSVSKLIGSPPGYIGYQEGGQLTEKVRRKPYSVVLFDEIEKAHPDLVNVLLQILEEGHMKDGKGRLVNFKNTIIILTSNIGAGEINKDNVLGFGVVGETKDQVKQAYESMRDDLMQELKDTLPPEFINRIDEVVIFKGLDEADAEKIADLQVKELNIRLKEKGIQVVPTPSAIKFIAEKGFDKDYGARNIRRKIQELIENPLADYIIEKNIKTDKLKGDAMLIKVEKIKTGLKLKE